MLVIKKGENMFNLKYAKTYNNKIFERYNLQHVLEDYFAIKDNIFCVADGVTRDSVNGEYIPYPKTEEEVRNLVKVYPNPSGAFDAAKICADNFIKYVSEYNGEISEKAILEIVKRVNKDIWEINKDRKIDYLKDDLYCCVAVGGIITDNFLYCFSIGDSHISAYDKDFKCVFTTINNHKQFEDYLENVYIKENEYDWTNPRDRAMVRRDYRNKPDKKYNGKEVSFGALTGEKEAEHYVDVYKIDLKNIKYICAYSDGCEPFFENESKAKDMILNPNNLQNEGKERTLVVFEEER